MAASVPHLRDIPVIMTSSLDELDSVVKCVEMGAEDSPQVPSRSDAQRVRGLAVHRRIESFFCLSPDADRGNAVDDLQHHVGEGERVGRTADASGELFAEENC